MLMALLPLAGWAQSPVDLSTGWTVNLSAASGDYTGVAHTPTVTLKNGDETLASNKFSVSWSGDLINVGTYTVTVSGDNVNTVNAPASLTATYQVKKKALTLTAATPDPTSVEYGTAHPAWAADMTGFVTTEEKTALYDATKVSFTVKKDGESTAYTADVLPAGTYTITPAYSGTFSNYELKAANTITTNFTVTPKALTGLTVEGLASKKYNGAVQKPANVVVKKDGTAVDAEFTVKYFEAEARTGTEATVKEAKTYYVLIESKAGENYSFTINTETYIINPATLLVTPSARKVYDGGNTIPTTVVTSVPTNGSDYSMYTFQGFVDDKDASNVTVSSPSVTTDAPTAGTVGTHGLTVDTSSGFTLANYTFSPNPGSFAITKKEVKVTADNDLNHAYGAAENFTSTLTSGTYVSGDEQAVKDAVKVVKADAANEDGEWALTPAFKTATEIETEFAPAADADEAAIAAANAKIAAAKAVLGNYTLKPTAGKLTYANAELQIALKESEFTLTKVYDGEAISLAVPTSEDQLTILGKQNATDAIDLSGLTLTITKKIDGNDALTAAGTYQVELSGAAAEHYDISYIPSQYKITKRPLKVTVYDQTFVTGKVQTLDTSLYSIEEKDGEGLADGDTAEEVFKLTTSITFDADGKVTSTSDGTISIADVGGAASKWANYNTTSSVAGTAKIVSSAIVLDDSKTSLVDLAGKTADETTAITFSSRTLYAEKWNTLVLPFEVTVKQLSDAFGYAVVDVLDQSQSDGNLHFILKVTGKIAANTPFMIYPSDTYNNLNQVTFTGVIIKKNAMKNATVSVKDGSNNKLVGTYALTEIGGAGFYYMDANGGWNGLGNTTAKAPIKPLRAYIDMSENTTSSAPIIYIEEPNGNTTAIKTLDAETMQTYSTDGWYNLNGVKLNGVPTEKGIYINNGKKVVINLKSATNLY